MDKNANSLELRIEITISQPPGNFTGIRLSETLLLPTRGFMEMCAILAEFQKLADRFKQQS